MRRLRPEYYSDTADRTTYQLDATTLEYQLETITARNQTHAFEIFCRKLCERTICPNLKPATGGTGEPEFLSDLAILKRKLSVKAASEIGHNDIEVMALGLSRESKK